MFIDVNSRTGLVLCALSCGNVFDQGQFLRSDCVQKAVATATRTRMSRDVVAPQLPLPLCPSLGGLLLKPAVPTSTQFTFDRCPQDHPQ